MCLLSVYSTWCQCMWPNLPGWMVWEWGYQKPCQYNFREGMLQQPTASIQAVCMLFTYWGSDITAYYTRN